ncbi:MAG: hypothetical protein LBG44_09425 [Gemmatimonadota bacterium]|nr:hypothetical protein [Gemmatimonadota bacterium]
MSDLATAPSILTFLLLGVGQVIGLLLIPMGYPGVWLQLAVLAGFGWWTGSAEAGTVPLAVLALISLSAGLASRVVPGVRGSREERRRFGALALPGALVGAGTGWWMAMPGSFAGALMGALLGVFAGWFLERSRRGPDPFQPPAIGVGPLIGIALRVTAGVVVAASALLAARSGG